MPMPMPTPNSTLRECGNQRNVPPGIASPPGYGHWDSVTPEAFQQLARGARSATPGQAREWTITPEGFESLLQPLRGSFLFLIPTRGVLRDPGLIAGIPPG